MTFHVLDTRHRVLASRDDHIAARHYFRDARMSGADAALIVDDDGIVYGGASHMPLTVPLQITIAASVHAHAMEQARRQERGVGLVLVPALAAARVPASEPTGPRKRVVVQVPAALRDRLERIAAERGVTAERVATDAVHGWAETEARG